MNFLLDMNQSTSEAALMIIKEFEEVRREQAIYSISNVRVRNDVLIIHSSKIWGKC